MRGNGRSLFVSFTRILVLAVLVIGGAFLITGCDKEKQEIARAPTPTPVPCTSIDPPAFVNQNVATRLGTYEVCVPLGQCVATQVDTENKMAQKYCDNTESATCRPGACGSGSCKPVFDEQNSPFLYIRGCTTGAAGPPGCNAGEELCKCTLYVPPRKQIDCDCGCR